MRFLERLFWVTVLGGILVASAYAFSKDTSPSDNRKYAVESRNDAFNRAENLYQPPKTVNFPLRKTLVDMTARQDMIHHPWFVYILGQNGNTIGYYVAKTVPINACDFLSSTEDIYGSDHGNVKMTSPSYDGIYYGGGGSSGGGCDAWVFEDSATNAMITIRGVNFFTSDQPLKLQAQPIKVAR